MRVLLIDGYNVIHRVPELHASLRNSLESARESLLRYCGRWRSKRGDFGELHIVFDGSSAVEGPGHRMISGVQVTYTRTNEDADDRIRQMLDDSPRNRECVVVTDDNELAAAVRSRGGGLMSAMEFAGVLSAPKRTQRAERLDEAKSPLSAADENRINADLKREWGIG